MPRICSRESGDTQPMAGDCANRASARLGSRAAKPRTIGRRRVTVPPSRRTRASAACDCDERFCTITDDHVDGEAGAECRVASAAAGQSSTRATMAAPTIVFGEWFALAAICIFLPREEWSERA
jgi:hypothetical protein